jgi:hypothetical protein
MVARMAEAGQSCDEPLHEEEEGRPHQDALAEIDLWGISPCRWYDGFDGQDATRADWTFPGGCSSVSVLICVPWEVFPMCYSFLSTCGRDICLCPMYFMFYFVLDFG